MINISSNLINNLKKDINGSKKDEDQAANNIKETIEIMSKKLLDKVKNDNIDLDVKDLKDLSSVYAAITQQIADGTTNGAPPVTSGVAIYLNTSLNGQKIDEEDDDDEADISNGLEQLSDKDIAQLTKNQLDKQKLDNFNEINK